MSQFDSSRLRGALDLSSLGKKHTDAAGAAPVDGNSGPNQPQQVFKVPAIIINGNEASLRNFMSISESVPVVIDFYSLRSEASKLSTETLGKLVLGLAGRVLLVRIDFDAEPRIVQAFNVQNAGSVVALLRGQPIPISVGGDDETSFTAKLNQLLSVAAENGIAGLLEVDESAPTEAAAPSMPPRHKAAIEFINQGEYAAAQKEYEAAISENPADAIAIAGLAQSKLLQRVDNLDFDSVLSVEPTDLTDVRVKADALCAVGEFSESFTLLLDWFEKSQQPEREIIKAQLLELFEIVGKTTAEVISARARLTNLLY